MAHSPGSDASHDNDSIVAESSVGAAGGAQAKIAAVKDKECPYCHQPFTSSSLGRHLDQYMKKKGPDGIHIVEEIRRLRGGVTRRSVRHESSARHEQEEDASQSPSAIVPVPTAEHDRLNPMPMGGLRTNLNHPNWQATGVINSLSDLSSSVAAGPIVSTPTGTKRTWASYEQSSQREVTSTRGDLGPEKDTARALELALREVLDLLQAATTRTQCRSNPFEYDLESQTFPSLCLRILPLPPTLSSASPFDSQTSVSLGPPGPTHIEPLRLRMRYQIEVWKWECLRAAKKWSFPTPTAENLGDEQDNLSVAANEHEGIAMKHLELAYGNWMSCSEPQRLHLWQIELMRALAREREAKQKLEVQLDRVQQEASQLQAQVSYLSRCQWPREMALWPPDRTPIGKEVVKELRGHDFDGAGGASENGESNLSGTAAESEQRWDYDRLVNKWQKVVREDMLRKTGSIATGAGAGASVIGSLALKNHQQQQQQQEAPISPATNGGAFDGGGANGAITSILSSSTGTPSSFSSATGAHNAAPTTRPVSQNKRTKLSITNGTTNPSNSLPPPLPPPPAPISRPPSSSSPSAPVLQQDSNNNSARRTSVRRAAASAATTTGSNSGSGRRGEQLHIGLGGQDGSGDRGNDNNDNTVTIGGTGNGE